MPYGRDNPRPPGKYDPRDEYGLPREPKKIANPRGGFLRGKLGEANKKKEEADRVRALLEGKRIKGLKPVQGELFSKEQLQGSLRKSPMSTVQFPVLADEPVLTGYDGPVKGQGELGFPPKTKLPPAQRLPQIGGGELGKSVPTQRLLPFYTSKEARERVGDVPIEERMRRRADSQLGQTLELPDDVPWKRPALPRGKVASPSGDFPSASGTRGRKLYDEMVARFGPPEAEWNRSLLGKGHTRKQVGMQIKKLTAGQMTPYEFGLWLYGGSVEEAAMTAKYIAKAKKTAKNPEDLGYKLFSRLKAGRIAMDKQAIEAPRYGLGPVVNERLVDEGTKNILSNARMMEKANGIPTPILKKPLKEVRAVVRERLEEAASQVRGPIEGDEMVVPEDYAKEKIRERWRSDDPVELYEERSPRRKHMKETFTEYVPARPGEVAGTRVIPTGKKRGFLEYVKQEYGKSDRYKWQQDVAEDTAKFMAVHDPDGLQNLLKREPAIRRSLETRIIKFGTDNAKEKGLRGMAGMAALEQLKAKNYPAAVLYTQVGGMLREMGPKHPAVVTVLERAKAASQGATRETLQWINEKRVSEIDVDLSPVTHKRKLGGEFMEPGVRSGAGGAIDDFQIVDDVPGQMTLPGVPEIRRDPGFRYGQMGPRDPVLAEKTALNEAARRRALADAPRQMRLPYRKSMRGLLPQMGGGAVREATGIFPQFLKAAKTVARVIPK